MTRLALDRVLGMSPGSPLRWAVVAAIVHGGGLVLVARGAVAARPSPLPPVEIELAPVAPPPEPPPPAPVETEKAQSAPTAAAAPRRVPSAPANAAAPAKAGAILTAKDDAPAASEPVSFVTDPDGGAYGSGVVAKGGTAKVGTAGPTPVVAAAPTSSGSAAPNAAPLPTTNLSRKPSLDAPDACKGYFPTGADDDHARVTLRVVVRPSGAVASAAVVDESPKGQGFGAAARACLLGRTFSPGLDPEGRPVLAAASVVVRFSR